MNYTFTLLFFLFSILCCVAQEEVDTTMIPFVSYWAVGDSYDFKIIKLKQTRKEGVLTKNDSSSYLVNFQVIDSTESSYTIKWTYKNDLNTFNIPTELHPKFSKFELTEVIYTTTELGEFVALQNWKEIATQMKQLNKEVIKTLSKEKGEDKKQLKRMLQPILDLYQTREGIEQMLLKEAYFIHFPFGYEYSTQDTLKYEEEIPNIFGGGFIRGDAKIYLDDVDLEEDYCVLIKKMKLNPEDAKKAMIEVIKAFKIKENKFEEAMKDAVIDIQDFHVFQYYYHPGVPVRIDAERKTIIAIDGENGESINRTIIELQFD